jgi:hypothetical protein
MTVEYSSGSVYNVSTGEFTAPRTAIYIIDYAVNVIDNNPTFTGFIAAIRRNSTVGGEARTSPGDCQPGNVLYLYEYRTCT